MAFALADGTIAMEGNGPRTGTPKICNVIFTSNDLVSLDSAVAAFMGIELPHHVKTAHQRGLGDLTYEVYGDAFTSNPFIPSNPKSHPIYNWELTLRKSFLKPLLFDTKIFNIFAWITTQYNSLWYYHTKGKQYKKKIMETGYRDVYNRILFNES